MRSVPLSTLALLLTAISAAGQEGTEPATTAKVEQDHRSPVFGRILDPGNRPMAGAEIHLVSNLVPGCPELGDNDVLRVVSNERGRFRANLLEGRGYSAWAWATQANGVRLSSPVHDDVRPGPALDLHLHRAASLPHLVLKAGRGGERYGKVLYRLGGKHYQLLPLVGTEGDKRMMPRLAGDKTTLLFQDEKGILLREQNLNLTTLGENTPYVVTPSTRAEIRVRVGKGKDALEGVRVLLTLNQMAMEIFRTDAQGLATLPMEGYLRSKTTRFRSSRELLLLKEGYLPTLFRPEAKLQEDGKMPMLEVEMKPAKRLEGRLLDADGHPRPGVALALFTFGERVRGKRRSSTSINYPLVFHTDAEGRFAIAGFGNKASHRLVALGGGGEPPMLLSSAAIAMKTDLLLGDLHPRKFIRAEVTVKNSKGRSLPDANLVLGEAGSKRTDSLGLYRPLWLFPDRRGRATVLYRKGLRPAFAASWQGGIAELAPKVANVEKGPLQVDLVIPRLITLRGTLVHPDLQAFHGATLRTYISRRPTHALKVTNGVLQIPPQPVRPDGHFEIRVVAGSKVMFQFYYTDPTDKDRKQYYSSHRYTVYQEDASDIRLELKVRASGVKQQGMQIGVGGMFRGAQRR
mgnify:CR=1 FL=1